MRNMEVFIAFTLFIIVVMVFALIVIGMSLKEDIDQAMKMKYDNYWFNDYEE